VICAFAARTVGTLGAIASTIAKDENARIARTNPELIFFSYAFVRVFNVFRGDSPTRYIKGMDKLSIPGN
jgi:hypothetical protein